MAGWAIYGISTLMQIEEKAPNKPNFPLIVVLFGVTIAIIFVVVLFALHWDGHHFVRHHEAKHATSQLRLPGGRGDGGELG